MSNSIVRAIVLASMMSAFAVMTGCSSSAETTAPVDETKTSVDAAAVSAADRKASQALQAANAANAKADQALSKTQELEQKLNSMFKKSMAK
jgi:uncharacterized protein YceK